MKADFWHERWASNEIGFHEGQPNALLVKYLHRLNLPENARLFLPLCGKARDISWLLEQGYRVVGVELSETAIHQFFDDLAITPTVTRDPPFILYQAPGLELFVGDFFALTQSLLGNVDAVYDRAALVALPSDMRSSYTSHLASITQRAKQLLIVFDYDQNAQPGPPFAIDDSELHAHYAQSYQLQLLESKPVVGGLKGQCSADEKAWLLVGE